MDDWIVRQPPMALVDTFVLAISRKKTMSAEELLAAALELPEQDRVMLATRILESVPDVDQILSEDDPDFFDELKRRSGEITGAISADDLWK